MERVREECWRVPMTGGPPPRGWAGVYDAAEYRSHIWGPIISAPDAATAMDKARDLFPNAEITGVAYREHPGGRRHLKGE